MHPAVESYLIHHDILSEKQIARAYELAALWQGTVPIVLWKLGWIDLDTFAALLDMQAREAISGL
jgi:hypothetical protein